jgi:hypothetical protein
MADSTTNSVMTSVPGFNYTGPGGAASPSEAGNPNSHVIDRRHAEWRTHQLRWRWLLDSFEGGEAYRQAIYGWDLTGLPVRNLIRHKREYPEPREQNYNGVLGRPPGSDMAAQATNDDYEMRRARTPVPMLLANAINRHLSKVFSQAPHRRGPEKLLQWYENVDGANTQIRDWMRDVVGPLLMDLGQLDLIFERPFVEPAKRGKIKTKADESAVGLDTVVASFLLPENVVWWKLDKRGRYEQVLVCEPQEQAGPSYRFWEPDKWTLFDYDGNKFDESDHPYGRPPIVRLFDRRGFRAKNVGLPRYGEIAEIQREVYNRSSELVLSDSTQAHPLIQAPEDYCQSDVTVPMGPGWVLPKKKNLSESGGASYEGYDILEFPKGSADSLRANIADLNDQADKCALLTKPAGAAGTDGKTVAQSGISKRLDADDGNAYLGEVASCLAKAERQIAEMFLLVDGNGVVNQTDLEAIQICYRKDFDLYSPVELSGLIGEWQAVLATAGGTPGIEAAMLKRLLRLILLGAPDKAYVAYDQEIDTYLTAAAIARGEAGELSTIKPRMRDGDPDANFPGTQSSPDSVNAASLASAGVLVSEVY